MGDDKVRAEIYAKLEKIFSFFKDVAHLIETLDALILNKKEEEVKNYKNRIIAYLGKLYKVERRILSKEKGEEVIQFRKPQRVQMHEIELLKRAITNLLQHPETYADIEVLVRDFLASLEAEISDLDRQQALAA